MKRLLLLLAFTLSACAHYEPLEYTPISEIPDGPGLLTGEEGEWTIYRKE